MAVGIDRVRLHRPRVFDRVAHLCTAEIAAVDPEVEDDVGGHLTVSDRHPGGSRRCRKIARSPAKIAVGDIDRKIIKSAHV